MGEMVELYGKERERERERERGGGGAGQYASYHFAMLVKFNPFNWPLGDLMQRHFRAVE